MAVNAPRRHHYVPQFYLRQFACADDANKVPTLERHNDVLVTARKSIRQIGYEESLYDFIKEGELSSIESDINRTIETPFSQSSTWSKIVEGKPATLDKMDAIPIYTFAQHLLRRNLETVCFMEAEHARFATGDSPDDLTDEEREMHAWISAGTDRTHALFRDGALENLPPNDAPLARVMVRQSSLSLRTSTNPTLFVSDPGSPSILGSKFHSLRTWWLTLGRNCGAFIIVGGPPGFSNQVLPLECARMINRLYLVQHLNSRSVRYLIADDPYLADDLEWAGYRFERHTPRGARYRR